MWRYLSAAAVAAVFIGLGLLPTARAHETGQEHEELACAPGETCVDVTLWGSLGLIFLGLIFLAVWFVPARNGTEDEETLLSRIPMMETLQRRIEKELTGWRRFQWPALGLFFILLGLATLAGWR